MKDDLLKSPAVWHWLPPPPLRDSLTFPWIICTRSPQSCSGSGRTLPSGETVSSFPRMQEEPKGTAQATPGTFLHLLIALSLRHVVDKEACFKLLTTLFCKWASRQLHLSAEQGTNCHLCRHFISCESKKKKKHVFVFSKEYVLFKFFKFFFFLIIKAIT